MVPYTTVRYVVLLAGIAAVRSLNEPHRGARTEHAVLAGLREDLRVAKEQMRRTESAITKFENGRNNVADAKEEVRLSSATQAHELAAAKHGRVVLFTVIFGEEAMRAPHLPLWAKSASGSGVDYIILSDHPPGFEMPPNMRHISISFLELARLISDKLLDGYWPEGRQLLFLWASKYKVIDVKPALGFLFRDYIADFAFWGHVDNDMLMGNVGEYLTSDVLSKYDIISGLKRGQTGRDILSTWGPFTIYRNVPKVTEFFRELDLKYIYDNINAMFVDEWGGNEWSFYNWSMTKLINDRADARGIRVADQGFNTGWDGQCFWKDELHDAKRCAECILKTDPLSGRNVLTWNRSLFLPNPDDWPVEYRTLE